MTYPKSNVRLAAPANLVPGLPELPADLQELADRLAHLSPAQLQLVLALVEDRHHRADELAGLYL